MVSLPAPPCRFEPADVPTSTMSPVPEPPMPPAPPPAGGGDTGGGLTGGGDTGGGLTGGETGGGETAPTPNRLAAFSPAAATPSRWATELPQASAEPCPSVS